ncbi:hypothetical protein HW555_003172 [Spodoptera exigua]|uniref:Glucose-6-phosphatase n=1 Tax=Spodoptera exigua TaxID=7107 RepID=A0A835GNC0_SPOEX|nr:hypothetical protein HW555_003172 [Spodoptera exigua]
MGTGFADNADFFEIVNKTFNPEHMIDIVFPLMTVIDSVFAAQLLLCLAFGGWLNAVMKWWFLEDRPYWWIRETTFYSLTNRPVLQQTLQTCETGPGSPSGHTSTAAMMLILSLMWISHVMHDRKCYIWWWKHVMYPISVMALISVVLARLFIATHFPHQCLLGALVGSFLAPALCIYVSDPFIWRYGCHATYETSKAVAWHVFGAVATILIAGITYLCLLWCGLDPHWTVKLAFRWCENPEAISVSTTPMYALVHATGSLLGWALCVTPAVAEYRHYSKNRSIIISAFATVIILMGYQHIQDNVCKSDAMKFYASLFIMSAIKPFLLLRVTPAIAMWPFQGSKTKKD